MLAGYQLAIGLGRVPATDGIQLHDHNRIRCENYVLDASIRPDIVLVGSSLSANLPVERIDPKIFNLGVAGDCVWTGLALIQARPDFHPQIVAIEVDSPLLRAPDQGELDTLTNPWWQALHRALPMLQTRYQPAGVFMKAVGRWGKRRTGIEADQELPAAPGPATTAPQTEAAVSPLTRRLLDESRQAKNAPGKPGADLPARRACAHLRTVMDQLARAGMRCVLVDIPEDASLDDTQAERNWREIITEEFPTDRYVWMPPLPGFQGRTADATHLIAEDALTYARFLSAELENIAQNRKPESPR